MILKRKVLTILALVANATNASTFYVVHNNTDQLSAFSIDATTGQLAPLAIGSDGATLVSTGYGNPADITDAFGKYLYIANWVSPTVAMFKIDSLSSTDKKITALTPANAPTKMQPWSTKVDPSGRYAYTGDYYSYSISQFRVNQTSGVLEPLNPPTVPAGAGTAGIRFVDASIPYAYVANMQANYIGIYNFDSATGQLSDTGKKVTTGNSPRGIWFDNNYHGYVLDFTAASISMYLVNPTDGSDVRPIINPSTGKNIAPTGMSPIAIGFDSSKRYVYVASNTENKVYMYHIESSGVLTPLNPPTIATGSGPRSIALDNHNHAYVINMNDYTISMYNVNPETGLWSPLSPATIKAGASAYVGTIIND